MDVSYSRLFRHAVQKVGSYFVFSSFSNGKAKVFYLYTYGSSTWLALQGLALVATPKLIITLLIDDTRPSSG